MVLPPDTDDSMIAAVRRCRRPLRMEEEDLTIAGRLRRPCRGMNAVLRRRRGRGGDTMIERGGGVVVRIGIGGGDDIEESVFYVTG